MSRARAGKAGSSVSHAANVNPGSFQRPEFPGLAILGDAMAIGPLLADFCRAPQEGEFIEVEVVPTVVGAATQLCPETCRATGQEPRVPGPFAVHVFECCGPLGIGRQMPMVTIRYSLPSMSLTAVWTLAAGDPAPVCRL